MQLIVWLISQKHRAFIHKIRCSQLNFSQGEYVQTIRSTWTLFRYLVESGIQGNTSSLWNRMQLDLDDQVPNEWIQTTCIYLLKHWAVWAKWSISQHDACMNVWVVCVYYMYYTHIALHYNHHLNNDSFCLLPLSRITTAILFYARLSH